jgi:hypothetical protein
MPGRLAMLLVSARLARGERLLDAAETGRTGTRSPLRRRTSLPTEEG